MRKGGAAQPLNLEKGGGACQEDTAYNKVNEAKSLIQEK